MNEDDFLLDAEGILERVDEYTLYCHYLEFAPDIGMKYNSPIRPDDDDPSFGIFPSRFIRNREYGWKDGGKGVYGDVFKLIHLILEQRYGTCSWYQAMAQIKSDFGLGPQLDNRPIKLVQYTPIPRDLMEIRIKSRSFKPEDFRYWEQFNICERILQMYFVKPLQYYWTYQSQTVPKFPSGLAYAYYIHPKYKLYFPHERKEFKFRNDMSERELEGFAQLKYDQDLLIITKSYKDVMTLRSFGYEAVAPRSENTLIAPEYLNFLEGRYKEIIVLFDNDGKHKADSYSYRKIWIPKASGEKDLTDYCKHYGPSAAFELIKNLV